MSELVFSDRVRALKAERDLTVSQLSKETGIPKRTLEKYLRRSGAASPGVETIRTICTTYDISADWLLGLTDKSDQAVSDAEATEVAARAVFEHFIADINHTQKWVGRNRKDSVQSLTLLTYFRGFHPACRVRGVLG